MINRTKPEREDVGWEEVDEWKLQEENRRLLWGNVVRSQSAAAAWFQEL